MAQYSDAPYQEFLLKDKTDKKSLLAAVEKMSYRRGKTNTGKALEYLETHYFTKEAGSRDGQKVPQIALVITDGSSNDDVIVPARRLKKQGVKIFSVGIGQTYIKDLENIASLPPERFVLEVDTFKTLEKMKNYLLKEVCVSVETKRQGEAKD